MDIDEIIAAIKTLTAEDKASATALINQLKTIVQAASEQIVDIALSNEISYVTMNGRSLGMGAAENTRGLVKDEDDNWCDPVSGEIWYEAEEYEADEMKKGQWISSSEGCW